ncbi:MAG: Sua5/YciO/YrdC/YwlC family protein [Patescibacteria group bacterium]
MDSKYLKITKILKSDGIGILPTDTLYGLVASAFSKKAVNRIFKLKKRNKSKKLIILISSLKDLEKFNIKITKSQKEVLEKFWPHATQSWRGKQEAVSIILNNIAFRLPKNKKLIEILRKTGPLVAPSANPESKKPAENVKQAKNYFGPVRSRSPQGSRSTRSARAASNGIGDQVDFYLSGGTLKSKPSTLIKLDKNGKYRVLRGKIK